MASCTTLFDILRFAFAILIVFGATCGLGPLILSPSFDMQDAKSFLPSVLILLGIILAERVFCKLATPVITAVENTNKRLKQQALSGNTYFQVETHIREVHPKTNYNENTATADFLLTVNDIALDNPPVLIAKPSYESCMEIESLPMYNKVMRAMCFMVRACRAFGMSLCAYTICRGCTSSLLDQDQALSVMMPWIITVSIGIVAVFFPEALRGRLQAAGGVFSTLGAVLWLTRPARSVKHPPVPVPCAEFVAAMLVAFIPVGSQVEAMHVLPNHLRSKGWMAAAVGLALSFAVNLVYSLQAGHGNGLSGLLYPQSAELGTGILARILSAAGLLCNVGGIALEAEPRGFLPVKPGSGLKTRLIMFVGTCTAGMIAALAGSQEIVQSIIRSFIVLAGFVLHPLFLAVFPTLACMFSPQPSSKRLFKQMLVVLFGFCFIIYIANMPGACSEIENSVFKPWCGVINISDTQHVLE